MPEETINQVAKNINYYIKKRNIYHVYKCLAHKPNEIIRRIKYAYQQLYMVELLDDYAKHIQCKIMPQYKSIEIIKYELAGYKDNHDYLHTISTILDNRDIVIYLTLGLIMDRSEFYARLIHYYQNCCDIIFDILFIQSNEELQETIVTFKKLYDVDLPQFLWQKGQIFSLNSLKILNSYINSALVKKCVQEYELEKDIFEINGTYFAKNPKLEIFMKYFLMVDEQRAKAIIENFQRVQHKSLELFLCQKFADSPQEMFALLILMDKVIDTHRMKARLLRKALIVGEILTVVLLISGNDYQDILRVKDKYSEFYNKDLFYDILLQSHGVAKRCISAFLLQQ